MFRKAAAIAVAAAAATLLWGGLANAQVRTAALADNSFKLAQANPENRIALVIGNSQYQSNTALVNPANDAQAVSQLLNGVGFEVVMAFDLARDIMKQTVQEFAARANEKGPNTVVLVYYAGHGLQVDGENYLVPVDAKFQAEADLPEQGVKLAEVMAALEAASVKMRIVILDACRNNPFGGASGGLAIVDAPAGSIVAYSTAPGTEALDGKGRHSPYAAAFMRTVKQPNLPIEQVFKKVRVLVNEATDTKQTPWESSSLTEDFVFFANTNVNNGAPVAEAVPVRLSVAELRVKPVQIAYEAVIAEDNVEYYEEFVRLYPADPRCDHIRKLLGRRQQMVAWQAATHANSRDAYDGFIRRFGNTDLGFAARRLHERPRVINIAFPRRGEGRFGDGRFGTRIDFGRLNGNNRPVIDFRNAGGRRDFPNRLSDNFGRPGNLPNRFDGNRFDNRRLDNNRQGNLQDRFNGNNRRDDRFDRLRQNQANLQQQQQQQQLQRQQQLQQIQRQQQVQQLQRQQQIQQIQRQQQIQQLQRQQVQRQQIQQQFQRQQAQRQPQVIQRAPERQFQRQDFQRQNFQAQRQQNFAPRQSFAGGGRFGGGGGGGGRFGGGRR